MSADLIKDVIAPEFNKQVLDAKANLKTLNDQFIDTLKSALLLRDATAGSTTFADLTKNINAAGQAQKKLKDDTEDQAKAAAKLQAAEEKRFNAYLVALSKEQAARDANDAKQIASEEKKANAYLIALSKEQSARDAADAKEMAANQRRLEAIDRETVALEAAQLKRAKVTEQDPSTYRGSGSTELTNEQFNTGQDKASQLANEKAALIASIEAENLNNVAKKSSIVTGIEQNTVLIQNIEDNIRLKSELSQVTASLKAAGGADAQLTAEQLRLTAAIKENNAVISQQIKQENASIGSDIQKEARLNELKLAYRALSDEEKANQLIGGKILTDIKQLDPEVKKADATLGNFGKSVGNYAGGIAEAGGKIFSTIRQIAYILPGIGIAGIFSLIGDGIIAAASKLDLFKDKITAAQAVLKDFNEVSKEANADLGKSQTVFKILTDTAQNTALSLKERTDAGAELIKQFPKELEGATALGIASGEEKKRLDELSVSLIQNAKARAALSKIQELQGKINDEDFQAQKIRNKQSHEELESITAISREIMRATPGITQARANYLATLPTSQIFADGTRGANGDIEAIRKRADTSIKVTEQNKASLVAQQDFLTKFAGGEAAIAKVIETDDKKKDPKAKKTQDNTDEESLKKQAANLKEQAGNEKLSYDERIAAAKNFYDLSNQLAELQSKKAIAAKKNSNDVFTLEDANRLSAQQETDRLLQKINDDALKARTEAIIKNHDDLEKEIQKYSDTEQIQLAKKYANEQQALALRYSQGLLSEEQYNIQKKQLSDSYNSVTIDDQISALENLRDNDIAFGGDGVKFQHQIDDLKVKSAKDANAQIILNEEATGKKLAEQKKNANKKLKDITKEGADAVVDLIQKVGDAQFEYQKQQIDSQKTALDTQTQRQIDAENRSLDSTQSKANKVALIQAQANDKKAQLDQQARKIDHDKAVFDREIAIAKIVENTAIAITAALAEFGIFGTAVAVALGVLGAVQIATVLAQPLPAFADGGVMDRTGLAKFGERGQEYRIEPTGEVSLTPGITTVGMVKAGTRFIDAETTTKILTRPEPIRYTGGEQISMKQVERYLKDIKENTKQQYKPTPVSKYPSHWNTDYFRSKIN